MQHVIPTAGAFLEGGDKLDFEDPKVLRRYILDLFLMEGAISICRKIADVMEDDTDGV